MAKKENQQSWEKIEEQAYHAFREWPIWLRLRQVELSQHLQQANPSAGAPVATPTDSPLQPKHTKKRIRRMS
ncbi:MAG: hypothetical protein AAFR67_04115 [Chloroflexota bacterium]